MNSELKLIKQLNELLSITSIIVSHDVHETLAIADKVYILSEGKIVACGTPDEIRNSESPWVQQFVHGHDDGPVPFHFPSNSIYDDLLQG